MRLRTLEMHIKYINSTKNPNFYDDAPTITDFDTFRVIPNQFPYDTIAEVHHLLIPKRQVTTPAEFTLQEHGDIATIISSLTQTQDYDQILYNFPHKQSAPQRFHLHLITLKRASETQSIEEKVRLALGELGATWEDPEYVIQNIIDIINEAK